MILHQIATDLIEQVNESYEPPEALRFALAALLEVIQPHESASHQAAEIRNMLKQPVASRDLIAILECLTNVIAESQYRFQAERRAMHEFARHARDLSISASHSIQAAENQAQSSFQGAQKTGNALERQVQDIAYRVRTSNKLDGMKVWLEQRLAIVDTRLDDYQSQGVQQHTGLASQLQKLSQNARELGEAAEDMVDRWIDGSYATYTDHLTGIGNRQSFEEKMKEVLAESDMTTDPQYIFHVWDVDKLASVNQSWKRETGDRVLKRVAEALAAELGGDDNVYRYGDDEFVVLSRRFEGSQLHQLADRLCDSVENVTLEAGQPAVAFTVSGGYTEVRRKDSLQSIFQRAFSALKKAKQAGGNCCWFNDDTI